MAQSRAVAAETKIEAKSLRVEQLEADKARLTEALNSVGQKLDSKQKDVAALTLSNEGAEGKDSRSG